MRNLTAKVFRPALMAALKKAGPQVYAESLATGIKEVAPHLALLEQRLAKSPFVVSSTPTIADLLCYCEAGQLVELGMYDFRDYPNITAWLGRMQKLPGYKENAKGVFFLAGVLKSRVSASKM